MDQKLLSIYIPTYNRVEKVINQIKFFMNEIGDNENIELVVCDNASTDNTDKELKKINSNYPFRYFRNDENIGICGNAYNAIQYTNGKYIWIVGDDDYLEYGVVKNVMNILNSQKNLNFIFLNYADCYGKNKYGNAIYKGRSGLVEDTWSDVQKEFYKNSSLMVFTTCIIHRRTNMEIVVEMLPLDGNRDYGWSFLLGILALKEGHGYFDSRIWIWDQLKDISWSSMVLLSRRGLIRSLDVLEELGFEKKQVRKYQKDVMQHAGIYDLVMDELLVSGPNKINAIKLLLFMIRVDWKYVCRCFLGISKIE